MNLVQLQEQKKISNCILERKIYKGFHGFAIIVSWLSQGQFRRMQMGFCEAFNIKHSLNHKGDPQS